MKTIAITDTKNAIICTFSHTNRHKSGDFYAKK